MADDDDTEKSEDPTQKRLEDAHERGDVVKSQEVSTWFVIAGATLILLVFSNTMFTSLSATFRGLLANAHDIPMNGQGVLSITSRLASETFMAVALPFALLVLAAIGGNLVQHRLVWSAQPLRPSLSKISPIAGLGRMFSKQALANFAKGIAKLALIGSVMTALMWPLRLRFESLVMTDLASLLAVIRSLSLEILGTVVAILAIVAAADYLFQYRQWFERQKMSMQELKEEFKQTEGDPTIRAKIRQMRQQRMGKRMMAAVPEASVVITNPHHYAVALKYEPGMNAPVCLAKGVDLIAMKIKEVAGEHEVPIVENPPLARALHATVEIDDEVPPEHYKAVAEIIGYVMKLRRRAGAR